MATAVISLTKMAEILNISTTELRDMALSMPNFPHLSYDDGETLRFPKEEVLAVVKPRKAEEPKPKKSPPKKATKSKK